LDKEILKGRISKILLGAINPHKSLKEALIIIKDISIFYSTVYEPWEYKILRQKNRFLKHPRFLIFLSLLLAIYKSQTLEKLRGK
jgi:hypothetical protein